MADNKEPFKDDINFEAENEFGEPKFDDASFTKEQKVVPGKGPLIIGGVLASILIWQLASFFMGNKEETTEIKAAPSIPVASSIPVAEKTPTVAPQQNRSVDELLGAATTQKTSGNAEHTPQSEAAQAMDMQAKQTIGRLEVVISNLTKRLDSIEDSLKNIKGAEHTASQSFDAVSQQIKQVNASIQTLDQQIKTLTTPPSKAAAGDKMVAKERNNPTWKVHAIIPGRAWLKNIEGQTVTVIEGDKLELYGTVIGIDAGQGTVVTSSGIILR